MGQCRYSSGRHYKVLKMWFHHACAFDESGDARTFGLQSRGFYATAPLTEKQMSGCWPQRR